ncbi:MAG: laccase domain-containing protein [Candidatus Eisenbacteria bacterium]|nr:laccase domain-containing protein [Candidatus Eisenbacteria bacterium]
MSSSSPMTTDRVVARNGLTLVSIPAPPAGVTGFVTARTGGRSRAPWESLNLGFTVGDDPAAVRANLDLVGAAAGVPPAKWARVRMVHGPGIRRADRPGIAGMADGLLTQRRRLPLALTVADCLPLFLWAPGPAIALLHCGWRGVAAGIVENGAVQLAAAAGCLPGHLGAWIGPGIGPCCYAVGWEAAIRVAPQRPRPGTTVQLDLPAEVTRRLSGRGLAPERIQASAHCTACRPDLFFSHRATGGRTGRMAALMMLEESD